MLATIVLWFYIFLLPLLYGRAFKRLLAGLLREKPLVPLVLTWLLGIAIITTLASFLSLIMPVALAAHLLILAGGLIILIVGLKTDYYAARKWLGNLRKVHWLALVIGIAAVLTTLEIATRVPTNPDSGQYHAQAIRWIETYRAVSGLGNLLTRFAFNSSWFVTSAVFSLAFLGGRSFHLVPSVLFLGIVFYSLTGIDQLLKKQLGLSALFRALLIPLAFNFMPAEVSSPGTDLPVTLIAWVLIAEWICLLERKEEDHLVLSTMLWTAAVFCVTIKLSAAVLLLGGMIILLTRRITHKRDFLLLNLGLAAAIALPWLIRNVILSGYLVYPFPAIDLFRVDWKIPLVNALSDMHSIQNWAKLPGSDLAKLPELPFSLWFPEWWADQTLFRRLILLAVAAAPFLYMLPAVISWKERKKVWEQAAAYLPVYAFVYAGLAFWFMTSPAFRFGLGFILPALLLVLIPPLLWTINHFKKLAVSTVVLLSLAILGYQLYTLAFSLDFPTLPERVLLPADYPHLPSEPCRMRNITVLTPSPDAWMACWYLPFPCTPHCEAGVELRGDSLQDGFRWP